jgi:hypothetical protein
MIYLQIFKGTSKFEVACFNRIDWKPDFYNLSDSSKKLPEGCSFISNYPACFVIALLLIYNTMKAGRIKPITGKILLIFGVLLIASTEMLDSVHGQTNSTIVSKYDIKHEKEMFGPHLYATRKKADKQMKKFNTLHACSTYDLATKHSGT